VRIFFHGVILSEDAPKGRASESKDLLFLGRSML
jgi:hypothetical protein